MHNASNNIHQLFRDRFNQINFSKNRNLENTEPELIRLSYKVKNETLLRIVPDDSFALRFNSNPHLNT